MSRRSDSLTAERHTAPLPVACPVCLRETTLTVVKRNAHRFVGEWCDGAPGARHGLERMVGPAGEGNR